MCDVLLSHENIVCHENTVIFKKKELEELLLTLLFHDIIALRGFCLVLVIFSRELYCVWRVLCCSDNYIQSGESYLFKITSSFSDNFIQFEYFYTVQVI